ncbi:MAG: hypothetical protein J6574_01615 [Gilliamella sp.]|nr:hypothetical protein [Gilliamella sp.]
MSEQIKEKIEKMRLFLITAKDWNDNEYDSFVIWAETPEQALKMAVDEGKKYHEDINNFSNGAKIEEVREPTQPQILLGSFNKG